MPVTEIKNNIKENERKRKRTKHLEQTEHIYTMMKKKATMKRVKKITNIKSYIL